MELINEKLTSLTGPALSRVNDYKRRQEERRRQSREEKSNRNAGQYLRTGEDGLQVCNVAPVVMGTPFGGDSRTSSFGSQFIRRVSQHPPPIGFKTELTEKQVPERSEVAAAASRAPVHEERLRGAESEASLYEGDSWSRLWFQRVMLLSLLRLLLFVRKVYEDYQATKTYNTSPRQFGHFLIAATTLFLPTIVFTVYRVTRYLQIALPERRRTLKGGRVTSGSLEENSEESQLRQALMSSSSATASPLPAAEKKPASMAAANEDEGLVTARQTPTNLEEFQDSRSQLEEQALSPAPSTAIVKDSPRESSKEEPASYKESVKVEKLGRLGDRESVRVTIGASEQILHGALFIFWQLKRQVDVMGYLVERACLWRKPKEREREELERLRTGSDGLEWFQDFYAAFLAILTQVYTLGLHWTGEPVNGKELRSPLTSSGSDAALGSLASFETPDLAISSSAKVLSETLRQRTMAGSSLDGRDLLIMSELVVSSAVVFSLLIAVRRKDDGPLTLGLSFLGWGSVFAARIILIALAFVQIGWRLMLPLIACHLIAITLWIYKISLDSFNDRPSERVGEMRWLTGSGQDDAGQAEVELSERGEQEADQQGGTNVTGQWSSLEHLTLLTQIFTLFALPSLFYWPIMFNLKEHQRPFKYLALILSENFLLMGAIWHAIGASGATAGLWYLLGAVGGFSIAGFVFVSLYVACKPSLTEYFARADELFNEAERAGIYFEFCSRVFKMPDLSKENFRRLMKQTEREEEIPGGTSDELKIEIELKDD